MKKDREDKIGQLHCGACMSDFSSIEGLVGHIKNCPAAAVLLPLINQVWMKNDEIGHPLSHFIQNCHKNAQLIKRYAYSIADEIGHYERSKIHSELCDKLGLDYNKFRPFESSNIINLPNRKEAERILWEALYLYASQFIKH